LSERLAHFQANVEAARQEIEDVYERYTGLGVPLTGEDFEEQVLRVVRGLGFVAERTKPTADGGIDIIARRAEPLLRGKYIIQCKNWTKPVGARVVRELYGVVMDERAMKGTLITTSRFTQPALEFAVGKPMELIDGDAWRALVLGMPIDTVEEVREGNDDLTAYVELLRLVVGRGRHSAEGLEQALIPVHHYEVRQRGESLGRVTQGELEHILSEFEAWVEDTVAGMKELIIVRPPADCRELYGEIVGAFYTASVHILEQLASMFRMEDERIIARFEVDAMAVFEPVLDRMWRLLALCQQKTPDLRDLMEEEGEGP